MNVCFYCGKGILFGRSHTHHRGVAGGRWKKRAPKTRRIFKPNLQKLDAIIDGKVKRVKLCMKCLKRVKKDIEESKKPFIVLAKRQPKKETTSEKPKIQNPKIKLNLKSKELKLD